MLTFNIALIFYSRLDFVLPERVNIFLLHRNRTEFEDEGRKQARKICNSQYIFHNFSSNKNPCITIKLLKIEK